LRNEQVAARTASSPHGATQGSLRCIPVSLQMPPNVLLGFMRLAVANTTVFVQTPPLSARWEALAGNLSGGGFSGQTIKRGELTGGWLWLVENLT